ncbi:MAG: methylated-DNA--[protein]-cysteine S-methyltransferase [Candidatus Cloacimonetes bacterium]|nr:methylated-DNA--[protein]-cysteine S-methyltransferase [Candidatus Cloacimonadota bacterium]
MKKQYRYHYDSPIGLLGIISSETDLLSISFLGTGKPKKQELNEIITETINQLKEYFSGKRKYFHLKLSFEGHTSFQKGVWQALSQIPYAKTASYSEIAKKISKEQAVRAVGNACGKNPFLIIIPCHRVLRKDGSFGGFSAGDDLKQKLLDHEYRFTK